MSPIGEQKIFFMTAEELKINVSNPEAIIYTTEELGFTILGGIRIDGLDRLRVTMKIEVINRKYEHYLNNPDIANLAIRHNLDLYNDVQVEKLIRKTAERLEVGSTELTKAVAEITSQLELYRLQELEAKQTEKETKKKILTPQEREAAEKFFAMKFPSKKLFGCFPFPPTTREQNIEARERNSW